MSTKHTHKVLETELPRITRHDLARFVKKGRRLRDGEIDKLSRSMGRGMVRLGSALAQPITAAIRATGLPQRIALARLWRREFRRARAELESHSERELRSDLRLNRSDIPEIAAEAAEQSLAAFVRRHPEYRQVRGWRGRREFVPG
jgi:uncharacterized protein YjiS (DUF1127 family)